MQRVTHMKLIILGLGFVMFSGLAAAPSSNVAWTSEMRHLIKNADLKKGKKIAKKKCKKCHGKNGADTTAIEEEDTPFLSGQVAHANLKQIIDYQDKKRDDDTMYKKVRKLSKQEAADVAAYYASQELPVSSVAKDKVTDAAIRLVTRGDGKRFIPPCAGCHGLNGEGSIVDVPALSGQNTSYFITTMTAYREGDRTNDIYSRMRFIAKQLTDKEVKELADYYAASGTGTKLLVVETDEDTNPTDADTAPKTN